MKRIWSLSVVACALLSVASPALSQSDFSLRFSPDSASVSGLVGSPWSADCTALLDSQATDGSTGAQAWSISLTADNASISAITIAGTNAALLLTDGFERSELTTKGNADCAGRNGALSAVILSFMTRVTLPAPVSASTIASVTVEGTIPDGGGSATLRYADGCQGSGLPVNNRVTRDGLTNIPTLVSKSIQLVAKQDCCSAPLNVGFMRNLVNSAQPYDGPIIDDGAGLCSGGGGAIDFFTASGTVGSGHVFAGISSNNAEGGVQGWSFSFALNGDVELSSVTTNGTVVDSLFDAGFKKTESIDPSKNSGQRGAVSAVVLSFTNPVVLPPTGTASVVDFGLAASSPQADDPIAGELKFQDGLRGSGQPVRNAITLGGSTANACNFPTASVSVVFRKLLESSFVRGNANGDLKVDIADAVWIINELFKGGPSTACPDAADANNDGQEDLADATYLVHHEFEGGDPPPAPYPDCGTDPEGDGDGLTCGSDQAVCP